METAELKHAVSVTLLLPLLHPGEPRETQQHSPQAPSLSINLGAHCHLPAHRVGSVGRKKLPKTFNIHRVSTSQVRGFVPPSQMVRSKICISLKLSSFLYTLTFMQSLFFLFFCIFCRSLLVYNILSFTSSFQPPICFPAPP